MDLNISILIVLIITPIFFILFLYPLARSIKTTSGRIEDLKRSQTEKE